MKHRFVWHDEKWLEVHRGPPRPSVFPAIIRDDMAAIVHPASGETFDSKSRFRETTKALGYDELGTDAPLAPQRAAAVPDVAQDIAQAWEMVEQGYHPEPAPTLEGEIRTY